MHRAADRLDFRLLMRLLNRASSLLSLLAAQRGEDDTLALNGGKPVRHPWASWPKWPVVSMRDRLELLRTLEGGFWWYGHRVRKFESEFAAFQDVPYCVTCSNGTVALEIALQALGIGRGDEVIVPAFSFFATASCVARANAMPVFVDVDESWCIDPERIEAAISPRTRAIIPVHFAGRVADMDRIGEISRRHDLAVIEDACHSWGSRWRDSGTGTLGDLGAFSFQMSKNLTAGEGGAIVTSKEDLAEACRSIVNVGLRRGAVHVHHFLGTNARITELQAALLSSQLDRLEEQTRRREANAAILDEGLGEIEGLTLQEGDDRITSRAYHYYCLRINPKQFGCSREKLVEATAAEGLPVQQVYPRPLYRQPIFSKLSERYPEGSCPVTEDLCARSGCYLPHRLLLGNRRDMQDIVRIFGKIRQNVTHLRD